MRIDLVFWLELVLAVLGLALAALFTLAYYRVVPRSWLSLPLICDVRGHVCGDVLDARYARVLGLPNSAFGTVFYALWIAWLAAGKEPAGLAPWIALATAAAFTMSLYLAWALIFRMRVVCRLCFAGHGINTALLALAVAFPWRTR